MKITVKPSKNFFDNRMLAAYEILAHVPVSHCVDVGAANGGTVNLIKRYAPHASIDAFEPFPGNIPLIKEMIEKNDLSFVTLHQAAVSATPGKRMLQCAKIVEGTEPGWEHAIGYSSGSKLAQSDDAPNTIEVEAVSIDETWPDRISFLKIDVQGTESDVLESARDHFSNKLVDMCYIEMDGNHDIMSFMIEFGFQIIAMPILISGPEPVNREDFEIIETKNMSNGLIASVGWDKNAPGDPFEFADHVRSLKPGKGRAAQTDIICVAPHFWDTFEKASQKLKNL